MTWWSIAAAVLLVLVVAGVAIVRQLRRRHVTVQQLPDALMRTDPRVKQFRFTGSNRIIDPKLSAADLRNAAMAEAEQEDLKSELATLVAFLQDVRDSMGADEAVFWRWSEQRDSLTPATWSTPGEARPIHFDMSAWSNLVQWSAEQRMLNFDVDARAAVCRLAAAPIVHEDRLIGVLSVSRVGGLDRGREHIKSWLPRHAAQVARLVLGAELRREYGRHMRQSQALLNASKRFQGHISQESLSKAICETAVAVSSATEAALIRWRAEDRRGWLQFATAGFRSEPHPLTPDSLVSRACEDGLPLPLADVGKMARPQSLFSAGDDAWTRGSLTIVPLKLEDRVIGAIVIASDEKEAIPSEEATNVGLLGAMAATSLEIVWEMEEVSKRARTDALTGLHNRRHFDELLGQMIKEADRFGDPVALIMADVDHFKNVNDTWGHDAGDEVLKSLADTLRAGVRQVDICSRFGGEEIAILLPKTTLQGAAELADRLRKQVGAKAVRYGEHEIPVTISCGVAAYPDGVITKEALFAAADRALYEAKSAGRNCVRSAVSKPTGIVR
jgi:diguanylate cyclase (GGDEF)-like protein